ncbi:unnamed protein product [Candidula unifasciata]|uniref:CHHC U11-48K-type domain-containing protein n=1 Tax=Candidula unifasciata TaxID=100452 RepID=A0A8S3YSB4_9EUPU|nr:unnamed protein product [Candidula unifasciata]
MINEGFEPTVECPYDNTHIISEKFISKHLLKCRENHKTHKKVACKFDKTHLIPKPELPYHLSVCPSRYLLDRELQLKASAGVDGFHCGDVKGPQIVTNYDSGVVEEEWGSEAASNAPVALFNKKVSDSNESEAPRTIPGANYPSTLPRSAAAASGEETCRKFPFTPSMVAQLTETSKTSAQPGLKNPVFEFSLSQTLSNSGFGRGRGRGNYVQQELQPVGALRFQLSDTMPPDSADGSGQVNMSQPFRTEEDPYVHQEFYDQTSEGNNSYSVPRPANSSYLRQQQNDLYNQRHNETLAQGYQSSLEQLKNNKVEESYSPETFTNGKQPVITSRYQDQTNVPRLPKGRGCLYGIEQLRRPGSSSFVQGSSYSNLPVASRPEGTSGDGSSQPAQQNLIQDRDSNFADADDAINETFQRAQRKLRKKLRQLAILEEKLAAGIPLNEEEKSKLEKKEEIESLMNSLSKHL